MATLTVICNSSPLINLAKTKHLHLLQPLYNTVFIPTAVHKELLIQGGARSDVADIMGLVAQQTLQVRDVKNRLLVQAFRKDLDIGESEVLALALEYQADLVILDEIDARRVADNYQLKITGFLGILIKAKTCHLIPNVKDVLDNAIQQGFWIHPSLYADIIARLGE